MPEPNGSGTVAAGTPPARWKRWLQIEAAYQGKGAIDPEVAMMFQGDAFDTTYGMTIPAPPTTSQGNVSWPLPATPAHYGTTSALTGIPPATVQPGNSNPAAPRRNYYAAYAGSERGQHLGQPTATTARSATTTMAQNGLQTWARWGYAGGDNFFNEPYPQNENDYFLAHGSATIAASLPRAPASRATPSPSTSRPPRRRSSSPATPS